MISNTIRKFLKLKGIKNIEYSKKLKLKNAQALNTKLSRNSFKTQELIKLAEMGNCYLAFVDKDNNKILLKFDLKDTEDI